MDIRKLMVLAAALTVAFSAASCKGDDDDTTTSKSFSGSVKYELPLYAKINDVITVSPSGVSGDDETIDIGYYWTATPYYTSKDTTRFLGDDASVTGEFEFKVLDTLRTYTLTCTAYASGYYTSSTSKTCTVVDPELNGTITEDGILPSTPYGYNTDDTKYYYKQIGSRYWFVRNQSAYQDATDAQEIGRSYEDCEVMDGIFGRMYTWEEAQIACPDGWRLPSADDWYALAQAAGYTGEQSDNYLGIAQNIMAPAQFNDEVMWEYWPEVQITNNTGFAAIPVGYGVISSGAVTYYGLADYAMFWSADESDVEDNGVAMMIYEKKPDLLRTELSKQSLLASVRCVKDAE